jgi:prepilin-type N-terminal cleavage/methylation domain-containing protein
MNVMAHKKTQRGDTLVEVLMAIVILSVVIVGAMTMMSRGLAAAQIALEHSQVRMSINGQIEMLRYARDTFIKSPTDASAAQWSAIVTTSNANAITYNTSCNVTGTKTGFYMSKNATQVTRSTYTPSTPQVVSTPGVGMWIETVLSPVGIKPAYIDFIVRACWVGSGTTGMQRTVTAVRLYDPSR